MRKKSRSFCLVGCCVVNEAKKKKSALYHVSVRHRKIIIISTKDQLPVHCSSLDGLGLAMFSFNRKCEAAWCSELSLSIFWVRCGPSFSNEKFSPGCFDLMVERAHRQAQHTRRRAGDREFVLPGFTWTRDRGIEKLNFVCPAAPGKRLRHFGGAIPAVTLFFPPRRFCWPNEGDHSLKQGGENPAFPL